MTREQAKVEMRDEIIAVLRSTATPERNAEQAEAILLNGAISTCMIAADFCPNGHGSMQVEPGHKLCHVCGFEYFGSL